MSAFLGDRRARHTAGIVALTVISAGIFVAIVTMFMGLNERQREIEAGIREDAVWAVYQADREVGRLIEALLEARQDPTADNLDAVVLRYDILYSRAPLIAEGKFANSITGDDGVRAAASAVYALIMEGAAEIDAMAEGRTPAEQAFPVLLQWAERTRQSTNQLAELSNSANNKARVTARATVKQTYQMIAYGVGALTLSLVLMVTTLALQLRQISRAGRELEEMSLRNARAATEAEAGNQAKSNFLAAMSHEIRTPLNGLIGMTDVLAETPLTNEQRRHVGAIRQSGDLLLEVITDILDFSKLESGETRISMETFDIDEVLEPIRTLMRPKAGAVGIDFTIEAPMIRIRSDPSRLRQVLINLVNNAIKFTPSGSVRLRISVIDDDCVRFEVQDTGVGINSEDVSKLFKEFSQVDAGHARQFGGTGLGLAICKRLVDALGGKIEVETTRDVGSCFWFDVPVTDIAPAEAKPPPSAERPLKTVWPDHRILVVEDNAINREVAVELLKRLGPETFCAEDGEEGIEAGLSGQFDLVFMDMQMPRVDGLTATRRLRELGVKTPIIGLTANAFTSDRADCLRAGMDDFLSKPVTRDKFVDALGRWLPGEERTDEQARSTNIQRKALEAEFGGDFVAELIGRFVTEATDLIDTATLSLDERDMPRCSRVLHTLKGSALTLGLDDIANLAADCIQAPDTAKFHGLQALVAALRTSGHEEVI